MLELKNVNISTYLDREIIKDLSIVVNKEDKLCIIGEEGNGKSTLMKYIVDENLVKMYCRCSGIAKKDNIKIGYLEQFLDSKWDDITVENYFLIDDLTSGINYDNYSNQKDINKLFNLFKLDKNYLEDDKKVNTLSGGEKVKVGLIKLLIKDPDILLLDEPTNDLDIPTLEWLEEYIKDSTIPVVFISHDETLLKKAANCVLHLEQINNKTKAKYTYEHIGYDEYVQKRIYNINRQNSIAQNERKEHEKQMIKFRQIEQNVHNDLNNISRSEPGIARKLKKKMKTVKSLEKRLENEKITEKVYVEESIFAKFHNESELHSKKVILDFKLDKLVNKEKELSKDINIKIVGNEKVCIIGENGVGKTTLIKKIYEYINKNSNLKCGYMPQNYEELLDGKISSLDFLRTNYSKEEKRDAMTYMASMKFTEYEMLGKISDLSDGQKAKLFILKLILNKCDVLILDEPTRNLSPLSNPVIRYLLKEFTGSIISISHDRNYINEVCDTVYVLGVNGLRLIDKLY